MVAFIAGRTAPAGPPHGPCRRHHQRRGRHRGGKIAALEAAGIRVADSPTEIPRLLVEAGSPPTRRVVEVGIQRRTETAAS